MEDAGFAIFGDRRPTRVVPGDGQPARDLIAITWNGTDPLHRYVRFDQQAEFDLLTIDYSGRGTLPRTLASRHHFRSRKTEGKGQVFEVLSAFLDECGTDYRYVSLIDDDIVLKVSDLHYLLHIADCFDLDSFAPSLCNDAFYSHAHTLAQSSALLHPVEWVEVMMPFYRSELLKMAAPFFALSISSWGLDKYVMPLMQRIAGRERTAVIDQVLATHIRPVRSSGVVYSNGLNAFEEMDRVRRECIRFIEEKHPALLSSDWYERTFTDGRLGARLRRRLRALTHRRTPFERERSKPLTPPLAASPPSQPSH